MAEMKLELADTKEKLAAAMTKSRQPEKVSSNLGNGCRYLRLSGIGGAL